jgi:hypothetical protein
MSFRAKAMADIAEATGSSWWKWKPKTNPGTLGTYLSILRRDGRWCTVLGHISLHEPPIRATHALGTST